MHIRRQVLSRDGEIERDDIEKQVVDTREEAEAFIRRWQQIFPVHGYSEENDYWWGRQTEGEFRLNRWFVEQS